MPFLESVEALRNKGFQIDDIYVYKLLYVASLNMIVAGRLNTIKPSSLMRGVPLESQFDYSKYMLYITDEGIEDPNCTDFVVVNFNNNNWYNIIFEFDNYKYMGNISGCIRSTLGGEQPKYSISEISRLIGW